MSVFDYIYEREFREELDDIENIFSNIHGHRFEEAERMISKFDLDNYEILKIIDLIYKFNFQNNNNISNIVKVLENQWFLQNLKNYDIEENMYLLFVHHGFFIKTLESFNCGKYHYAYDLGKFYYDGKCFDMSLFYFTGYFDHIHNKTKAIDYIVKMIYDSIKEIKETIFTFFSVQSEKNHEEEIKNTINYNLAKCFFYGSGTQIDKYNALCIIDKLCKKGYEPAKEFKQNFPKKDLQKFYISPHIQNMIDEFSDKISNEQYLELCNTNKNLFETL